MSAAKKFKRASSSSSFSSSSSSSSDENQEISDIELSESSSFCEYEVPTIVQESLQNPLVLHKVIAALDFYELRTCRLVSETWSKISSEVLRKRDSCTIMLRYDRGAKDYRRYSQYGPESTEVSFQKTEIVESQCLRSLNKILEKSKDFPCTDFSFNGSKIDDGEVQLFFQIYGDKIRTLELEGDVMNDEDARDPVFVKRALHEILQRRVANIENLRIENFDYVWTDQVEDQFLLPSLKSFQWLRSSDTVYKILMSSPNLRLVRDIHVGGDVDVLIRSHKISTVKEIRCGGHDSLRSVDQFVSARPQIQKLRFLLHSDITSLAMAYEKLFEASKETLQVLELSEGCSLAGIKFPKLLRNLKTLKLGVNCGQPCFPCRINLNETFPNLVKLDCSHVRMYAGWDNFFPPPDAYRGDLPCVKILKVNDGCTKIWIQKLHDLCPNFKHLVIYSESDIPNTLPGIFRRWRHLESLEIEITYVQDVRATGDSTFTGISDLDCFKLSEPTRSKQRMDGYEKLRIHPSICNMKDLRSLRIAFQSGFKTHLMPLTYVSGLYAFSLLPDLKVTLEFDHSYDPNGLELLYSDLSPYMNIRHRQAICSSPEHDSSLWAR